MWYWFDEQGNFWKIINIDNPPIKPELALILDELIISTNKRKILWYKKYLLEMINYNHNYSIIELKDEAENDINWLSIQEIIKKYK